MPRDQLQGYRDEQVTVPTVKVLSASREAALIQKYLVHCYLDSLPCLSMPSPLCPTVPG